MIDEFESHEEFVELRARSYSCLTDGGSEDKKGKSRRKCTIKWKLKFEDYKNCLEATQLESKINHLEKKEIDKTRSWRIHRKQSASIKNTVKIKKWKA